MQESFNAPPIIFELNILGLNILLFILFGGSRKLQIHFFVFANSKHAALSNLNSSSPRTPKQMKDETSMFVGDYDILWQNYGFGVSCFILLIYWLLCSLNYRPRFVFFQPTFVKTERMTLGKDINKLLGWPTTKLNPFWC